MGWGVAFRVMNHPSPGIRNRRLQLVAVLFSSSLIAFVQLRAAFPGEAAISMEDTLWMEALVSDVRDLSLADQLRMVVDSDYRGYVGGHRINAFICALLHPLGLPHAALARLLATLTSVAVFVVLVWVLRDELGALTVLLVGVFHALLPARSIIMALYFMGNHSVAIDGDSASGETYCLAIHQYIDPSQDQDQRPVSALRYIDRFVRWDDGWRIEHRKVTRDVGAFFASRTATIPQLE